MMALLIAATCVGAAYAAARAFDYANLAGFVLAREPDRDSLQRRIMRRVILGFCAKGVGCAALTIAAAFAAGFLAGRL